jgi:hypothetical protein
MTDGTQVDDDPKSEAGKRPISLPSALRADVELHLARYAQPGPAGRLFVGPQGGIPRRRNFNRVWKRAVMKAGIPAEMDLPCTICAIPGARGQRRPAPLLKRLWPGSDTPVPVPMIYQHAIRERDQAIAAGLDVFIDAVREDTPASDLA